MKITDKIISIPPYISTSWDQVSSLHSNDTNLIISLMDVTRVAVPNLSMDLIKEIYNLHTQFLEQQTMHVEQFSQAPLYEPEMSAPLKQLFGTLDSLTQALQHNPAYSHLAPLPQEIVSKIESLGKTMPPEELSSFLHPVDGCNCMYCQISRILKQNTKTEIDAKVEPSLVTQDNHDDEVNEDDLHFEEWAVESIGDKMYQVTNKLDPQEHYSVFLGNPIGCTCGKQNCEHIVAVLRH